MNGDVTVLKGTGRRAQLTKAGSSYTAAYTSRGELSTVTDWLQNVTSYTYDVSCLKISWTRFRSRCRAAREQRAHRTEHRGGATAPWERGRLAR
jgi:hypothetical protein